MMENQNEPMKSSTANRSEIIEENGGISCGEGNLRSDAIRGKELQIDESSDKASNGTSAYDDSDASLVEAGVSKNHFQATGQNYKKEVENETITFNFDSSMPFNKNTAVTENITKQTAHCDASDSEGELDSNRSPQYVGSKTKHPPAEGEREQQFSSTNSQSWSKQSVVLPKHEVINEGYVSLASQLLRDEGEASFSAASLSDRSGSVAYSGSISLRSDAGTTSARSFEFPTLQLEWNSSPTTMAKRIGSIHKNTRDGDQACSVLDSKLPLSNHWIVFLAQP